MVRRVGEESRAHERIYRKRDERQKMEGKVYGILRSGGGSLISQASGALCGTTPVR